MSLTIIGKNRNIFRNRGFRDRKIIRILDVLKFELEPKLNSNLRVCDSLP